MARLWSSGFELNSNTANMEWTITTGTPTIQTSTVRSGTYAAQITSLASATAKGWLYQFSAANSTAHKYFRFYFRYATAPSIDDVVFQVSTSTTFPAVSISKIVLTSTGTLKLFNSTTLIGSASSALVAGTWYRVELEYDGSTSVGTHVLNAKIDGVQFAGASNLNIASGVLSITLGGNLASESNTTGNWFFDDIAINDATGTVQNSFPGAGNIMHLRPNAAGDSSSWSTNVGGTAGTANNYTRVNDVTPDDATSYNGKNTSFSEDLHNIDNTPAGIGSSDTINVIQVGVRYAGAAASLNTPFQVEYASASLAAIGSSATITPANATYVTNANAVPRNYPYTAYQTPDPTTLTKANLDTSQIGYLTGTGATNEVRISAIWLLVEWTAAVAIPNKIIRILQAVNGSGTY